MPLKMDIAALDAFVDARFPQARSFGFEFHALRESELVLRLPTRPEHLRPGGTVSGPTLMTLADSVAYFVILAHLGPVALAVTTNLNMHFMRKPEPGVVLAKGTLLKLGQRLAVCEVRLYGEGEPERLYGHATVTYSIPPSRA